MEIVLIVILPVFIAVFGPLSNILRRRARNRAKRDMQDRRNNERVKTEYVDRLLADVRNAINRRERGLSNVEAAIKFLRLRQEWNGPLCWDERVLLRRRASLTGDGGLVQTIDAALATIPVAVDDIEVVFGARGVHQ